MRKTKPPHFGQWLRREIENRLMTCAHFARVAGVSRAAVMIWLSEPHPAIRGDNIVRIARALEIDREVVEAQLHQPANAA